MNFYYVQLYYHPIFFVVRPLFSIRFVQIEQRKMFNQIILLLGASDFNLLVSDVTILGYMRIEVQTYCVEVVLFNSKMLKTISVEEFSQFTGFVAHLSSNWQQ